MINRPHPGHLHIHNAARDGHTHLGWDNAIEPIATVRPGEEVHFNVLESSGGKITAHSTSADISRLTPETANPVTGPIYVEGARPGQTLVVEILSFGAAQWGWTALIPGFGLLADEFPDPLLLTSRVREGVVELLPGIRLPLRPFAGTMGVAPAEPGRHPQIPPYATGGNMDTRHLTAGAVLYLPVRVAGALFSIGDSHAAQGDGEVCGTAVESPIDAVLRFGLSERPIKAPEYRLGPQNIPVDPVGCHATTGVTPDLMQAAREAVMHMIDFLGAEHGLSPEHAYMLCSTAGDLSISEIVDTPNWVVSLRMPLGIFA